MDTDPLILPTPEPAADLAEQAFMTRLIGVWIGEGTQQTRPIKDELRVEQAHGQFLRPQILHRRCNFHAVREP